MPIHLKADAPRAQVARLGPVGDRDLAGHLMATGQICPHDFRQALAHMAVSREGLTSTLSGSGVMSGAALALAVAGFHGLSAIDAASEPADARLIDRIGAAQCIRLRILPWKCIGGVTVIACADPAVFARLYPMLSGVFGRVAPVIAEEAVLTAAIVALRATELRRQAETRVPERLSCRGWRLGRMQGWLAGMAMLALAGMVMAPGAVFLALMAWIVLTLGATAVLRGVALLTLLRPAVPSPHDQPQIARLPVVSVMVPLYRETDIAPRLLRRLGRLDYPRDLLDVVLVIEENDQSTRAALTAKALPGWMRIVTVPDGPLKTKPRALNFALDYCRGSIIGIYDAEDAPEPDQITRVVRRFHERGPQVACLQGALDYYNPRTNWVARCFSIEYAAWFRVVMPGLQRLGLPLPLGGTTLFLRRSVLEELGAWDAHNVTEDADLGIRIARAGYRTEMIETTTYEEANCRPRAWVKQRSRWIKGHIVTWAVHMRDPVALWRDLGPRAFIGYQVVFLGAQSQVLLAPLLWSFWVIPFGVTHPATVLLAPTVMHALFVLFLLAELLTVLCGIVGARKTRHRGLWIWSPTLHFYLMLGTIAGWRAIWEVFTRPFYWAKTSHGHFDGQPAPVRNRASGS